jgi:hypothetical protein
MDVLRANVLLDNQIISADAFTALLIMAVASTLQTVPVVTPLLRWLDLQSPRRAGG